MCLFRRFILPSQTACPRRLTGFGHLYGPILKWYSARLRAYRRKEYPMVQNQKDLLYYEMCHSGGPFHRFKQPAPGRLTGSNQLCESSISWYRSRIGSSRMCEYPNGSKIKIIRFKMKFAVLVSPFNPFKLPARGRPHGYKHLYGFNLSWYSSNLGSSRRG